MIFAALFWLTARRGVSDPVCGMKVDKSKAIRMDSGTETFYFCSEYCLHAYEIGTRFSKNPVGSPLRRVRTRD